MYLFIFGSTESNITDKITNGICPKLQDNVESSSWKLMESH